MDSFFLAEPIDFSEVKTKKTFNINPRNFSKYQLVPQTLLHKETL